MAPEPDVKAPRFRKVVRWLGSQAAGAVVGAAAVAAATAIWLTLTNDPPLGDQLEKIREDAARNGLRTEIRADDLRGLGDTSYIVLLRSNAVDSFTRAPVDVPSDEIDIYENRSGELEREFAFRPSAEPEPVWVLNVDSTTDVDGDRRPEIVGAYSRLAMGPVEPVPIAIAWDPRAAAYRLHALTPTPPPLAPVRHPGAYGRQARRSYRRQLLLHDAAGSGRTVRAFPTEGYTVVRGRPGQLAVLLTGYLARAPDHADPQTVQVIAWRLDLRRPQPEISLCPTVQNRPLIVHLGHAPFDVRTVLRRAWSTSRNRFFGCG